jgi:tol-pal system protein YbgF
MLFLSACATGSGDDLVIDEEAFGQDAGEGTGTTGDTSADEAEVLSLLGITKDEQVQMTSQEASAADVTPEAGDLQSRIKVLEDESTRKNVEMSNLKAELAERDRRIEDLQKELSGQNGRSQAPPTTHVSGSFEARYNEALALYQSRDYRTSLGLFDELLSLNVNNSLIDNCQYWKGECYYGMGDYNQAVIEFQKIFTYSKSNKFDDAQLKLGMCYMMLGDTERARTELEKLLSEYPDSEYVGKAQSFLSRL